MVYPMATPKMLAYWIHPQIFTLTRSIPKEEQHENLASKEEDDDDFGFFCGVGNEKREKREVERDR